MTEPPIDDMSAHSDAHLRAIEAAHGPGRFGVAAMKERLAREAKAADAAARLERDRHDELVDQIQRSAAPHWSTVPLFWIGLIGLVATVVLSVASLVVSLKSLELQRQPPAGDPASSVIPAIAPSTPMAIAKSLGARPSESATTKAPPIASAGIGQATHAAGEETAASTDHRPAAGSIAR